MKYNLLVLIFLFSGCNETVEIGEFYKEINDEKGCYLVHDMVGDKVFYFLVSQTDFNEKYWDQLKRLSKKMDDGAFYNRHGNAFYREINSKIYAVVNTKYESSVKKFKIKTNNLTSCDFSFKHNF